MHIVPQDKLYIGGEWIVPAGGAEPAAGAALQRAAGRARQARLAWTDRW